MKIKLLLVLCSALILTNCSVGNDTNEQQNYKRIWHLINVSGGISGVNENFQLETITWSFNETTSKLTVVNNNQDDAIQDGLDSGTYDYSILNEGGQSYISIGTSEFGEVIFSQNGMQIDGNKLSTGTGADGFIYSFELQVIVAD